jgi:hypothetical protein
MMDVSRHKSVETLRRYVKDADEFTSHAAEIFMNTPPQGCAAARSAGIGASPRSRVFKNEA